MNRKNVPLILMLVAGAVTCIISLIREYSILKTLIALFVVFVIFFFLGSVMKWTLDYFDRENEKKRKAEEAESAEAAQEDEEDNGDQEEKKA